LALATLTQRHISEVNTVPMKVDLLIKMELLRNGVTAKKSLPKKGLMSVGRQCQSSHQQSLYSVVGQLDCIGQNK